MMKTSLLLTMTAGISLMAGSALAAPQSISAANAPPPPLPPGLEQAMTAQDAAAQPVSTPAAESAMQTAENTARPRDAEHLQEILRAVHLDNPTLRAARAELRAVNERLPQAQAGYKPTVAGEGNVTWADIDQDPGAINRADGGMSKMAGLSLTQPLFRGGRTMANISSAESVIWAQRSILNATEHRIMRDVATAYMNVLRDQAVLDLRSNNQTVIARQLQATRDRFQVGELTRTDISQAEARFARAEADRTQALGNLRTSRSVYEELTGHLPGTLQQPKMVLPLPRTLDDAVRMAEEYNPNVITAHYRHLASKSNIDGVFGELLPQVQLFGSLTREWDPQPGILDETTTKAIGVSASIPFYAGGAIRSRVREAKYTANQRMLSVAETSRAARQETIENWEALEAARAEIRSREAQVEAARVAREGVYQEADLGGRTILDTLNADQEFLDAQVALVSAQRNETVAAFMLAATLGLLTPKALGFPEVMIDDDENLRRSTSKILGMDVDLDEKGR